MNRTDTVSRFAVADLCSTPEALAAMGVSLAPAELAAFVAAWRRDREELDALRSAARGECTTETWGGAK